MRLEVQQTEMMEVGMATVVATTDKTATVGNHMESSVRGVPLEGPTPVLEMTVVTTVVVEMSGVLNRCLP